MSGRWTIEEYVDALQRLRAETGEGILACRKAFNAHPCDYESAKEHLFCAGQAVVRRPGSKQPCGCPV